MLTNILSFIKKKKSWAEIEYFNEEWKERIALMAKFITPSSIVLDLGCGKMWLKEYMPESTIYIPVDYLKRSPEVIVCDFNKKQYPDKRADIAFISGCLEYIAPYNWFISSACAFSGKVILSYCTTNQFPEKKKRNALAWVNHLSESDIVDIFKKNNFQLIHKSITANNNSIFVFRINEKK
ncbi:MAG: hypothetical protein HZA79_03935 [Sphingobacteriales bacterium]|nr:hypothetical protein [Sphingobacteriales bacterium]